MNAQAERLIEQAEAALKEAKITPGSLWKHWKGQMVKVISGAVDEALLTPVVIYQHTHGGTCWSRCLNDWSCIIKDESGRMTPRFTPYPEKKESTGE